MTTFKTFVKRFGKLQEFIFKEGQKILKENEKMLVDLRNAQHHAGLKADDSSMGGYSTGYAKRRQKKGLQTAYVDLHFTGKMHKGTKVLPVKYGVDLKSKEPYEYYVRANFPGAWGLTKSNAEVVSKFLADLLAPRIKKYLIA